jgi:AAA family ATP:ADP antiporter
MDFMFLFQIIIGLVVAGGLGWGFVSLLRNIKDRQELKKFIMLGFIFGAIIGAYWMLRPLKDSFFSTIVGDDYRGWAKILSVVVIMLLVLGYSKLVDWFPKHKLLYIMLTGYALVMFGFMFMFMNSSIGLANTVSSPYRILGWAWYFFVESIGTIIVPLFWAFTADITMPESAKRGFPIMVLFAQIGNICGPLAEVVLLERAGSGVPFVGIVGAILLFIVFLVWLFRTITPAEYMKGYHETGAEEEKEPGFLDGLTLLATKPYLLCIMLFTGVYEILITVLDLLFKSSIVTMYPLEADQTMFLAKFGVSIGIISALSLIFRIGELPKKLGMAVSLAMLPVLMVTGFIVVNIASPYGSLTLLYALFAIVASFKALNYALNQPTLKMLYIPTSKDAKFKSQSWSEMFGSRGAKAAGGGIKTVAKMLPKALLLPSYLGLAVAMVGAIWVPAILYAVKKYNKAIKDNEIVC